jgi:hypothetical protein
MATMEQILRDNKDRFDLRYSQSDNWPPYPTVILRLQGRGYLDSLEQLTAKGKALLQSENE